MKVYLEMGETEQLEKAATYLRDKLLMRLLVRLGCRISEALALTVEDIHLDFQSSPVTGASQASQQRLPSDRA